MDKPLLTPDNADDARSRIAQFVRWHVDSLNAPAPVGEIRAMLEDKFEVTRHYDGMSFVDADGMLADTLLDAMHRANELRVVRPDHLPSGYSPVEDPS